MMLTQNEMILQRLPISEGGRRHCRESKGGESKDKQDLDRQRGWPRQSQLRDILSKNAGAGLNHAMDPTPR